MARSFSGSGDKITLPAGFNPTHLSFSIAVWLNPSTNNGSAGNKQRTILCANSSGAGFNFQLGTNTGTPSVLEVDITNTSLFAMSTGTVANGSWTHAGFTYNNGSGAWAFYINGALDSSGTGATNAFSAGTYIVGFNQGANAGGTPFYYGGSMADLFVPALVLSAGQFAALAKGQRPSALYTGSNNIFFSLPLDGLQSPEPDYSGNAFNGTLTGTSLASGPPATLITPRWPMGSILPSTVNTTKPYPPFQLRAA